MPDSTDARRRWFGLLFLILAAGMLLWGQTLLRPRLSGLAFVAYWMACFILTFLAVLTALQDLRATRRREAEERRQLLERTWKEIKDKPDDWDQIK